VSGREKKLAAFARENDVMLFVAGRKSSNGKVLHDVCRAANPRTYFIETEEEIDDAWFEGASSAGITGATSTPQWLMRRVKEYVERKFERKESEEQLKNEKHPNRKIHTAHTS
jgi:4-hydroxy-3-methylbut-2-enyl diphosphate reductase